MSSDAFEILDAPDQEPLYAVPEADEEIVSRAVEVAREGFEEWRWSTVARRVQVLTDAARLLEEQVDVIAPMLVRETGKPMADARGEVASCGRVLRSYTQAVEALNGRVVRGHSPRVWGMEIQEPVGVAALITSWNMPLQLAAMKVGAAVAAGCSFVLKPSPLAADSVRHLVLALREAGLPSGAASLVHGGSATGMAMASHDDVDAVSFTGSHVAGAAIAGSAALRPRRLVMELGGKSANVVFEDADLDAAAAGLVSGFVRNQGAVCTAGSRILVHRDVYDEVVARVVKNLSALVVGDPYGPVDLGAVRTPERLAAIEAAVHDAERAGAEVLYGGDRVDVAGRSGLYLRPALVSDVAFDAELWRDETFGPVASIRAFDDEDEAVHLASDTRFGLAAGVWSEDARRLDRMARRLDVGTVYLNSYHRIDGIPLAASGRNLSGFGSEGGPRGISEFLVPKSLHYPSEDLTPARGSTSP